MIKLTLFCVLVALNRPLTAHGRSIAVLEYRARVKAAARISHAMAEQIQKLTSNKVVSPDEARRRLGASVDSEVAQCSGESPCIARLGRKLGCDEVILIGISQLGDLIVAIQRIDTKAGKVLNRLADSVYPPHKIDKRSVISYLKRLLPPTDFKRYGKIIVRSSKRGDKVYVDNIFKGLSPVPPIRVLAPDRYQIKVTRAHHAAFVSKLDVLPDTTVEVTPVLTAKSKPPKWYQHWWVWAVGGVIAGTATAFAVVSMTRGQDKVPAVIRFGNE